MANDKSIFRTKLTQVSDSAIDTLGDIRRENGKIYKYVQVSTGTGPVAAVAGNMVYYRAADFDGGCNIVCTDLSDTINVGAGMLMAAPTNGQYCWIQVWGPATLNTALTAGADGNALTPAGSTDGTLDVSAAVTDAICAHAIDISEKEVFLRCDY